MEMKITFKFNSVLRKKLSMLAFLLTVVGMANMFAQVPSAPVAVAASNFTCTSMNANWEPSACAINYYIDVSTNLSFSSFVLGYADVSVGNVTTYNVTGLAANSTYYYRVRAENGSGVSLNSNTISISTSASGPPILGNSSNVNCTFFDANWSAVSGATVYSLDVSIDPFFGAGNFVGVYDNFNIGNVTSYTITGLTPNASYYYRLRADNGCSTSLNSNSASETTTSTLCGIPSTIASAASAITCTSFTVNWTAVTGTLAYVLDVSTDASFATFLPGYDSLNVGNVTTYGLTGLTTNTTYYYRLRRYDGNTISSSSNTISIITACGIIAPAADSACGVNCTSFTANWSSSIGAIAYFLDVSTDSGFSSFLPGYNNLNVGNTISSNLTNLTSGVTYYYRVRADNGMSTSLNSNTMSVTPCLNIMLAPVAISSAGGNCLSFYANWNASFGATTYFLDVSTDASFSSFVVGYNNLDVSNVTTYNVTGLGFQSNAIFYYRLRASDGNNTSSNSNTITVTIISPVAIAAPSAQTICSGGTTSIAVSSSTNGATYSWIVVENGVTGGSSGSGSTIAQTLAVTGSIQGVATYTVIATSNGCNSSPTVVFITVDTCTYSLNSPVATVADNFNCNSFNANWDTVSGATTYFLDVSTDASFVSFVSGYSNLNVGNDTTFNITGLADSVVYYYRLRASNGSNTSLNSNTIVVNEMSPVAIATPSLQTICSGGITSVSLSSSTPGTTFSWTVSQTAISGASSGSGSGIFETLTLTGITQGYAMYSVMPMANGCTGSPVMVTVIVDTCTNISLNAPVATVADNFTCTSFNANWDTVAGATTYFLDVSTDTLFGSFVSGYNNLNVGNDTTFNLTGLADSVIYYYRIRASDGSNTSLNSNTIAVYEMSPVAIATPSLQTICSGGTTSVSLFSSTPGTTFSWTASQTAISGASSGTGSNISETLTLTGITQGYATYSVTPTANGCTGSTIMVYVIVDTCTYTSLNAPVATAADNFTCTSFNANWAAVSGATTYFLDVSTDASFGSFVSGYNNLNVGNITTFNCTGLTTGYTYYYRLRASDGNTTTLNSNIITADIICEGITQLNESSLLMVYPNPAKTNLFVRCENNNLPKNIVVTDMLGKMIKEITSSEAITEINLTDMQNGAYLIKVVTTNAVHTQRVIVSK